jgi:hypothetical protein
MHFLSYKSYESLYTCRREQMSRDCCEEGWFLDRFPVSSNFDRTGTVHCSPHLMRPMAPVSQTLIYLTAEVGY